tara:strand:+ start:152 stop:421 length:270 start_codon:yes stop_codon:yes gene_type:complete
MLIDTPEKLAILLFGINAGKDLELAMESFTGSSINFGNFESFGFSVDNAGKVEPNAYDFGLGHFAVIGAKCEAEREALEYWHKMNEGAE